VSQRTRRSPCATRRSAPSSRGDPVRRKPTTPQRPTCRHTPPPPLCRPHGSQPPAPLRQTLRAAPGPLERSGWTRLIAVRPAPASGPQATVPEPRTSPMCTDSRSPPRPHHEMGGGESCPGSSKRGRSAPVIPDAPTGAVLWASFRGHRRRAEPCTSRATSRRPPARTPVPVQIGPPCARTPECPAATVEHIGPRRHDPSPAPTVPPDARIRQAAPSSSSQPAPQESGLPCTPAVYPAWTTTLPHGHR